MAIKAVLFDLDDTLLWDERSVDEAFQATCREAVQFAVVDPDELERAVRKEARALYESLETYPFTQRIGINPFEGLWGKFSEGENEQFKKLRQLAPYYRAEAWTRGLRAVGVDDPELGKRLGERFAEERRKRPYVYEETFPVLNALKGKYRLLLLTNGAPDLQKEKIEGIPGLTDYFEHIVISGIFGEGKPAVSIFRHALDLLGIGPEEGVMVGDKLTTDILGSSRAGIKNVWINRRRQPRDEKIRPDFEIASLTELPGILQAMERQTAPEQPEQPE